MKDKSLMFYVLATTAIVCSVSFCLCSCISGPQEPEIEQEKQRMWDEMKK